LHAVTHAVPLHVTVPFAGAAGQGVHEVPHVVTLVLAPHAPEQRCVPDGQAVATHVAPLQAVVVAGVGQSAQVLEHDR
jgi:hypothetical protein